MKYTNVNIESLGFTIPETTWSSADIEQKLSPLYERLRLPEGRLELMTGISERRFWPADVPPSVPSVNSCRLAIEAAQIDPAEIGLLVHGSVCRDFLEPATASGVHHRLGLRDDCIVYDVSNACLGILNGMLQAANMIELGQIRAALVVGSENGRQLVETTIRALNEDPNWTRKTIKPAIASLTIGSASCAVLLTDRTLSDRGSRLIGFASTANTRFHDLCQSHQDQAGSEMAPLMETDSEMLMHEGIATGRATLERFLANTSWSPQGLDRTVCHQVGGKHRQLLLDSLGLSADNDYITFPWLGNTGSAALPVTLAHAAKSGFLEPGQNVGLFGIGSGINCVMLGCRWEGTRVEGQATDFV